MELFLLKVFSSTGLLNTELVIQMYNGPLQDSISQEQVSEVPILTGSGL